MRAVEKLLLPLVFVVAALSTGCAAPITSIVSERYQASLPARVAILPVIWEVAEEEDETIGNLFRAMTETAVAPLNYSPISPAGVDAAHEKYGRDFLKLTPREAASLLHADSVLYIRIKEWKSGMRLTYAYMKISAAFELYSRDGTLLWSAEHSSKESDLRLDRETMELAVVKAYEPRIEKFVAAVFTTLPPLEEKPSERKTYYEWLP